MSNIRDKLAGRRKEFAGKMSGDKKREIEGKAQAGAADVKDKAKDAVHKIDEKMD